MKTTWNELDRYSQPKPFVNVRLSFLDGRFIANHLALLDTGSRWSFIPGVVVSQDAANRAVELGLQLPSGDRKRIVAPVYRRRAVGIWLSAPEDRPAFKFALGLGADPPEPVAFFVVPIPRGMKPHLILGCDFLFAGGGLCIDARRRRFRLGLCPSEAAQS